MHYVRNNRTSNTRRSIIHEHVKSSSLPRSSINVQSQMRISTGRKPIHYYRPLYAVNRCSIDRTGRNDSSRGRGVSRGEKIVPAGCTMQRGDRGMAVDDVKYTIIVKPGSEHISACCRIESIRGECWQIRIFSLPPRVRLFAPGRIFFCGGS